MEAKAEKSSRSIGMSPVSLAKWQAELTNRRIHTADGLLAIVTDIDGLPTARKAIKGEPVQNKTWLSIFDKLKLERQTFFPDCEWHRWNQQTLWGNLWELGEGKEDRFGIVLRQPFQDSGLNPFRVEHKGDYQKELPIGKEVLIELPAGISGYLILVEHDSEGRIELISPSCVSEDPKLTGDIRRLPQHPDPKYQFFKPTILGNNLLWAGIFAQLPDWAWLENLPSNGFLDLQSEHLRDLWNYASNPPPGSQIWRSSYVVVN